MLLLEIFTLTSVILVYDIGLSATPLSEFQRLPECGSVEVNCITDVHPDAVEDQKILKHNKKIKHSKLYFVGVTLTLLFLLIYYEYKNISYKNRLLKIIAADNENLITEEVMSQKCNPADSKEFLSSIKLSAKLKSAKHISKGYKHKLNEALKSNQQHLG